MVWFLFRVLRRCLAYQPGEVGGVCRLLDSFAEGCPGHVPVHLLVDSSTEIGFQCDSRLLGWERPGLLVLSNSAGPILHSKAAFLDAWRSKIAADLRERKGFLGGPYLDVHGTLQLLNSDHDPERDKALLRVVLVGGVWNGFVLGKVREQAAGSAVVLMAMVTFLGTVLFFLWLRSVKILSFMIFGRSISLIGPGVLSGMDGYLCSLGKIVALSGQRILLTALVSCWSVLLGPTLLVCLPSGKCRLSLMLRMLLDMCLMSLMS